MESRTFSLLAVLTIMIPSLAQALTIAPADFYTDVRAGTPESVGINLLTREGVVGGYGNRFFGRTRTINRAEFLKIALALHPGVFDAETTHLDLHCFPDVRSSDWFSRDVCLAKRYGLIGGYEDGLFHPDFTVSYGEALKILTELFNYSYQSIAAPHWAEAYYRAAVLRDTDLPVRITLDTPLTRGLAARLAAGFLAESRGQLAEFRRAERGDVGDSSVSSSSSSSVSAATSSSSSSVSATSRPLDPISDTAIRSQFLLLGEVSSVLGAASIFIEEEPVDISVISVNLTTETKSIQSLLIYDENRRYLGRATLNTSAGTNRNYRLPLSPGTLEIGKRETRSLYIRAQLSPFNAGGESGQAVQIANIVVEGNGMWGSEKYTKQSTASSPYLSFVTSRSVITSVKNALDATGPLVTGSNKLLGAFTFDGRKSDQSASITVTTLIFSIEQTGGISLENVVLKSQGIPDGISCTTTASLVTCSAIPALIGSLTDEPRTLELRGNIIASDSLHASLRLTLNASGNPLESGAVSWSDGSTTFYWVALESPVVSGTYFSY